MNVISAGTARPWSASPAPLEPYNILFLEDVMPAVYPDEIKALADRTSIPIVGSELLMTRWQLREWLEKHVSQIVMTDAVWNGGIAETRKIAALAETFGVPLVLHNVAGAICHAACMHLGAHIPNLYYVESVRAFYKGYFPVLTDFSPTVADGPSGSPCGTGAWRHALGYCLAARRSHPRSLGGPGTSRWTPRHGRSLGDGRDPLIRLILRHYALFDIPLSYAIIHSTSRAMGQRRTMCRPLFKLERQAINELVSTGNLPETTFTDG